MTFGNSDDRLTWSIFFWKLCPLFVGDANSYPYSAGIFTFVSTYVWLISFILNSLFASTLWMPSQFEHLKKAIRICPYYKYVSLSKWVCVFRVCIILWLKNLARSFKNVPVFFFKWKNEAIVFQLHLLT